MAKSHYDPEYVAGFYDDNPEKEWGRLVASPSEEVKLHIHNHYLAQHLRPGMRVLEIGAGPGRFTMELHKLGCSIVVADISQRQIELNKSKSKELAFESSVEQWIQLDICDMSLLAPDSFDAVVAYGGPLSYVFDRAGEALTECARVLKPDGILLVGVMSLWGSLSQFYSGAIGSLPITANQEIIRTGDLTPETDPTSLHFCHLYRSEEVVALLAKQGFTVIALSASNSLSTNQGDILASAHQDPDLWDAILAFEVEASASPGYVDGGTHLIAVAALA